MPGSAAGTSWCYAPVMRRGFRSVSSTVLAAALACAVACGDSYDEAAPAMADAAGGDGGDGETVTDASADGGVVPTWLPPPGVYRYRVNGRQRLSVGNPEYRDEGPVAPAEIRAAAEPGCWTFRLCLLSGTCADAPSGAYSEVRWSFCVRAGQLEELSSEEKTRWLVGFEFQSTSSKYECAPGQAPYAPSGFSVSSWSHVCQGAVADKTYASSGPYRFEGIEPVRVGSVDVPGYHFHQERTVVANTPGAPAGDVVADWWLAANGLPLRVRRGVAIRTDIGFGVIDFRESTKDPTDAGVLVPNDCLLDAIDPAPLPDGG